MNVMEEIFEIRSWLNRPVLYQVDWIVQCFTSPMYQVLNKQVPVPVAVHETQVPVPVVQVPVLGKQVQVQVPVLS